MTFALADVVPWGRNLAEYRAMFALSETDLRNVVLGCGDGPASFNVEAHRLGHRVLSVDPIYRYSVADLQARIDATAGVIAAQLADNASDFVWKAHADPAALIAARLAAMRMFLEDLPLGLREGRYVDAALPELPFAVGQFGLALCSHFLFLYSAQRDYAFHLASILEMCRVAREVRIFPLLELGSVRSRHLDAAMTTLKRNGYQADIIPVDYELQRGGNQMLRVTAASG